MNTESSNTAMKAEPRSSDVDRGGLRPQLIAVVAVVVLIIGLLLRVRVLGSDRGDLLADEAFTGLLSAEIRDGYLPVMISAIGYTAPIESYLFVPIMSLFGMSVVGLKMVSVVLWCATGLILAIGARCVFGRGPAFVAGGVAWLPMGALLVISFRAYEGYASGLAVFALMSVVALRSVAHRATAPRVFDSFVIGLAAGALMWVHPVFLVVAVPVGVVVSIVHLRSVRHWWIPAAVGGIVGSSILLAWNLKNGWPSFEQPTDSAESISARFVGLLTELVPRLFGIRTYGNVWILPGVVGVVALLIALGMVVRGVRTLVTIDRPVAAVVVAPLVAGLPLMALLNNASFTDDGRYGIVFVVPIALAVGAASRQHTTTSFTTRSVIVLALWMATVVLPWSFRGINYDVTEPTAQAKELVTIVESAGFDRLAGYYWAVLPAEYISQQRIRVAVSGHPSTVLLADTQRLVESAPPEQLALVFLGEPPEALLRMPRDNYEVVDLNDWRIFLPRDGATIGDGQ